MTNSSPTPWMTCLLGPPGSGKGTQGALLARHLQGVHVSVGDAIRERQAAGVKIPRDRKTRLVDTDYTVDLIREVAARGTGPIVLDGFPRAAAQVEALTGLPWACKMVLSLEVDLGTAITRMKLRGRNGEDLQQIGMRHLLHERAKTELQGALSTAGLFVVKIDASSSIDQVHSAVVHSLCG